MRHRNTWVSAEQKIQAWLELCDLCFDLMDAGWRYSKARTSIRGRTKKGFAQIWEERFQKHRQLNQKILARMLKA